MSPALRTLLPLASLPLVAGLLGVCGVARAQSQTASDQTAKAQTSSVPQKPVRKPDQVLTNDSVALLAVKRAPEAGEAAGTTQQPVTPNPEANATTDDTAKKTAELASLEKQIQDKQKRIVLLLRLFVDDEEPFLRDPANPKGDDASKDRRKYEQDELLYETSQLAKLKAHLNELTATR